MDWKYFATAAIMIAFGCVLIFVPILSMGSGDEWPAGQALNDGDMMKSGAHQTVTDTRPMASEIVKLPAMTAADVEQLLSSQKLCRMALNDEPQPYIIALDYMYMDGKLYFHFADYGRKMDLIRNNPNVSVEIDNFCEGAPDFDTVLLMGKLELVTDSEEQKKVAEALLSSTDERGGERNVAARHGLESLDIAGLTSRPSAMYRLNVNDYVALRSPG